ncbi:hypothetical protein FKW77_009758 [Venturia effusa]|uniref:Lipocalin-like domain-containing protein n=1 Tax=Venturia effusa TaxID=50376 RepID=A0A517L860_9PEZI|nr:hypothetical protein FKW77_009758 [Venturia effusa]
MTKHAAGIIMYTPDGYMSAQISIPGQKRFESTKATEADWAESGKRYFAYSGPFYVTEEDGNVKLRHNMLIGNRPNMVGDVQLRAWRFEEDGNLLILSSEEAQEVEGERRRPELRWRKLEDNTAALPPDGDAKPEIYT